MFCNKCGKKIDKESIFCNFCGNKISRDPNKKYKLTRKITSKKLGIILAIIIGTVAIFIACFVVFTPKNVILQAIKDKNYTKAHDVYEKRIKGDREKEKEIVGEIAAEVSNTVKKYKSGKITYEQFNITMDEFISLGLAKKAIKDAKKEVLDLHNSKSSYESAEKYENQEDYINAIIEYEKVIKEDIDNYSDARDKIGILSEKYKEQILNQIREYEQDNDYRHAIAVINKMPARLSKDSDIKTERVRLDKLLKEQIAEERKLEKEKAKNNQLITVEKTEILVQSAEYKSLYPDLFAVIIQNNSEKTIRSYTVAMLGWDKNGYPLKIKQNFLDRSGSYEFLGNADNVNITKGSKYGKDVGWSLEESHKIVTTKAIVIEAEFYDDTTWSNAYYEFFLDEFQGKPL